MLFLWYDFGRRSFRFYPCVGVRFESKTFVYSGGSLVHSLLKATTQAETAAQWLSCEGQVGLIALLGLPGIGKGYVLTQTKDLLGLHGIGVLSSSDCLRAAAADREHLFYREAQQALVDIHAGRLVSDSLTSAIVLSAAVALVQERRGMSIPTPFVVSDGFPRTPTQAWNAHPALHGCIHLEGEDEDVLVANMVRRLAQEGRVDDTDPEIRLRRIRAQKEQLGILLPALRNMATMKGRNGEFIRSVPPNAKDGEKVKQFISCLPLTSVQQRSIISALPLESREGIVGRQVSTANLSQLRPTTYVALAATTVVPA